jgi:hypothetical protein
METQSARSFWVETLKITSLPFASVKTKANPWRPLRPLDVLTHKPLSTEEKELVQYFVEFLIVGTDH